MVSLSLRKPDCDICVKLPEVSKKHCRIELNENNEVIAESANIIAAFNKSSYFNFSVCRASIVRYFFSPLAGYFN